MRGPHGRRAGISSKRGRGENGGAEDLSRVYGSFFPENWKKRAIFLLRLGFRFFYLESRIILLEEEEKK